MFPTKELPISGPEPDYSLEAIYGEPVSYPWVLLDGSLGTQVRIIQPFFDGYMNYDRFGKIVDHFHGEFGDAHSYRDTLYPSGAEYHESYTRGLGLRISTLDTEGALTETFVQDPNYYDDPLTTVHYTAGRVVTSQWFSVNNSQEINTKFYDNGDRITSFVNSDDSGRRVLSYDSDGSAVREQRFDENNKLIYDVTGPVNGKHSSMQVRNDGVHTVLFEGSKAEYKELQKVDGTFQTFSYSADQTHGGASRNDSFSGFLGGEDTFVFGASFANDSIRNFEAGRDILEFIDPAVDEDDISFTYANHGNDTIVHVADEGTITLKGSHIASLSDLHIVGEGFGLFV